MVLLLLRSRVMTISFCVLLVAGSVSLHGRVPQAGQVAVTFAALSATGQPVADLTSGDVSIRIAGKARAITSLTLKKLESTAGGAAAVPPPFAVNTPAAGRSVLIVIDEESVRPGAERGLHEAIGAFLDGLGSADRVALSVAPRDAIHVGFDDGVAKVREALSKVVGRLSPSASTTDHECRTRDTLTMLRGLLTPMGGSDAPATVLFLAGSLTLPGRARSGSGASCEVTAELYQGLSSIVSAARVNMYVGQGDVSVTGRDDGLQNLAGVTGAGQVLNLSSGNLTRLLAETSAYYVAMVQADPSDRPGQSLRLEVRVNRDGVTTRATPEFLPARAAAAAGKTTSPRDMIRTTAKFHDLPLRAMGLASRGQGGKMTVLAMAEPIDPATKITGMSAGLVDSANKIVFQATADDKQLGTFPITIPMAAGPGAYRLRVAATDSAGRSGAVDLQINTEPTPAGSLMLGSLLLAVPRDDGSASPALQFKDQEKIVGYLEMYGQLTGQVSARMEIASSLDGPAIVKVQPGGRGTSEPDKFILTAELPIAALAPGDYVVRVFVQMEGQAEGLVMRTLRKLPK